MLTVAKYIAKRSAAATAPVDRCFWVLLSQSEMMVWVFLALQVTPQTDVEVVVADATLTQPEIIIIEIEWFYCTQRNTEIFVRKL